MPLALSTFTTGDTITVDGSTGIKTRLTTIEQWLNYGIVTADLPNASRHIKPFQIYKPNFYGAPAPRCEAISSDTHYRWNPDSDVDRSIHHMDIHAGHLSNDHGWVVVKGMGARVKVPYATGTADVMCNFYTYETGGELDGTQAANLETARCAEFALFVNGARRVGTLRPIFSGTDHANVAMYSRKNHSAVFSMALTRGIYDISLRVRVIYNGGGDWKHIWVRGRSLVAEAHWL